LVPELDLQEWGCNFLKTLTSDLSKQTREMEHAISTNNPKIFYDIRNAKETATLKTVLKQLRNKCRKQAKEAWYEWRVKLAVNMMNRFGENMDLLNADKELITKFFENLNQLLESVKTDKQKLLELKPKEKDLTKELTRLSLSNSAPPTPGNDSLPAVEELEENIVNKESILKILAGFQQWEVKTLTLNEVILRFNDQYLFHMTLGGLTEGDEQRMIAQKTWGIIPNVQVDELTTALVESAAISNILDELTTTSKLRDVLGEISFRIGRIHDLKKEIIRLERIYTIHHKRENGAFYVEVEISNSKNWSKFLVGFGVDYCYPFGNLNFSFKNLFGNVNVGQVEHIINRIPSGYGRLTKICLALKNI